jgi:hypothetical protein
MSNALICPMIYEPKPCEEIGAACHAAVRMADRHCCPVRMEFNSIELYIQPGELAATVVDRWWKLRNESELSQQQLVITLDDGFFTVRSGDRYQDKLCFDEMLGIVAYAAVHRTLDGSMIGLRTQHQHDSFMAWCRGNSNEVNHGNG